jgi:Arc/MetJ-type ribon-helix-helix transcriptional regulator
MTEINRKKAQITASVSPSMKKRCVKIVENGSDYSSLSDIVSQSLSEFLARYDERQKLENKDIVLITA